MRSRRPTRTANKQTTYIHFTIAVTELPDTADYIGEIYCQRRVGFRFMDWMEDVFRKRQRVEQESEAVDKSATRYSSASTTT